MAANASPWSLIRDQRNRKYLVRFRLGGRQFKLSTKTTDRRRAAVVAAKLYQEALNRKVEVSTSSGESLAMLMAGWLETIEVERSQATFEQYKMYCRTHFLPFFGSPEGLTTLRCDEYRLKRLREVQAPTVSKELSALRGLVSWCVRRGDLSKAPEIASPNRGTRGTVANGGKGQKVRVDLTAQEVEEILRHLPERTRTGAAPRAFYTVMWETALRKGTLERLEAPGDYQRGAETLRIRSEIDKSRYGRPLPLTVRAREALDSVCPVSGVIFGRRDLRYTLKKAAMAAGLSGERAHHLSNHDFRHARITYATSQSTNLAGTAYLAGHRRVTTTNGYVHGRMDQAQAVLDAMVDAEPQTLEAPLERDLGHSWGTDLKNEQTPRPD